MEKGSKFKILIVDDTLFNRELLYEILHDTYDILEANDGEEAIKLIRKAPTELACVLLDINMPNLDGFGVLNYMNEHKWIEDVPVIMISSEVDRKTIKRAYELGATDFINRPFDAGIVKQRVKNTIKLYDRQRTLHINLKAQESENAKNMSLMVSVLSHIVEFRNGESGAHILNVNRITGMLLCNVMQISDRYKLTNKQIGLICTASALHDIGKISIDERILNKPGRLTPEEFEIMKTHSAIGAEMLSQLIGMQDEPLIQYGYEICRWHHERYDGGGYPDHLVGEKIPISAQIVSLADVYDALTADRCYKKAIPHDKAMEMILNGECGQFNPLLIQALKNIAPELKRGINKNTLIGEHSFEPEVDMNTTPSQFDGGLIYKQKIKRLEIEREKVLFFLDNTEGICFTHRYEPEYFKITTKSSELLGIPDLIVDPKIDQSFLQVFDASFIDDLRVAAAKTTIDEPEFRIDVRCRINGEVYLVKLVCRAIWLAGEQNVITGSIGKSTSIEREI